MIVGESLYVTFCEEVWNNFKTKTTYIEHLFDDLIDIFQAKITDSPEVANKLNSFIKENCTGYSSSNPAQFTDLLFRARPVGDYDPNNIHELYHIPFSKGHVVTSHDSY
jgi:hypothetical protein